jgi:hypothetical protein
LRAPFLVGGNVPGVRAVPLSRQRNFEHG